MVKQAREQEIAQLTVMTRLDMEPTVESLSESPIPLSEMSLSQRFSLCFRLREFEGIRRQLELLKHADHISARVLGGESLSTICQEFTCSPKMLEDLVCQKLKMPWRKVITMRQQRQAQRDAAAALKSVLETAEETLETEEVAVSKERFQYSAAEIKELQHLPQCMQPPQGLLAEVATTKPLEQEEPHTDSPTQEEQISAAAAAQKVADHKFDTAKSKDRVKPVLKCQKSAGDKFEDQIRQFLERSGIRFMSEEQIKKHQIQKYGRPIATPDFLLLDDVRIDGQQVCWLDAKAQYGSVLAEKQGITAGRKTLHDQACKYKQFGLGAFVFRLGACEGLTALCGAMVLDGRSLQKHQVGRARPPHGPCKPVCVKPLCVGTMAPAAESSLDPQAAAFVPKAAKSSKTWKVVKQADKTAAA